MDTGVHVHAMVMDIVWTRSFWENVVWTWWSKNLWNVAWTWTRRETGFHRTLLLLIDKCSLPKYQRDRYYIGDPLVIHFLEKLDILASPGIDRIKRNQHAKLPKPSVWWHQIFDPFKARQQFSVKNHWGLLDINITCKCIARFPRVDCLHFWPPLFLVRGNLERGWPEFQLVGPVNDS